MLEQINVVYTGGSDDPDMVVEQSYKVLSHPIDKSKWYIIHENNDWRLYDRWMFEHVITASVVCNKYYGEFQLPILEDAGKFNFTVVLPSGFVSMISKEESVVINYKQPQRLNCGDVRFR